MNVIIYNALISKGIGDSPSPGWLVFSDDTITDIGNGQNPDITSFDKAVNAEGNVVCPGFIDTHSHSDVEALLHSAILPKLHQGITTEILGQDGISVSPLPKESVSMWRKNIGGLDGDSDDLSWDYPFTSDYLEALKSNLPCSNFAYLAPHGNIRNTVMGFGNRLPSSSELKAMENLLDKELSSGAIGFSSGLVYTPCTYSDTYEVTRLCHIAKAHNGMFVVHQRNEGANILESMNELYKICKATKIDLHISHFKVLNAKMEPYIQDVLDTVEKIRDLGVSVTADQYPYTSGSTMLGSMIPSWVHEGGTDMMLARLKDEECRKRIREELHNPANNWNNGKKATGGARFLITSLITEKNQKYIGKTIAEIAQIEGKDDIDACMDLLYEESNHVGAVCFYDTDDAMYEIFKQPYVNICTDGLLQGKPHPRVYGAFPRVLGNFCREKKLLSLGECIHKMTSQAALAMHIKDRGILAKGMKADIVIFNPDTVTDVGDYINPCQYARGIEKVIVNGKIVLENNEVNSLASSGRILLPETKYL